MTVGGAIPVKKNRWSPKLLFAPRYRVVDPVDSIGPERPGVDRIRPRCGTRNLSVILNLYGFSPMSKRSPAVFFIFITLLIDVTGFGIIIPVMPKLVLSLLGEGANP